MTLAGSFEFWPHHLLASVAVKQAIPKNQML